MKKIQVLTLAAVIIILVSGISWASPVQEIAVIQELYPGNFFPNKVTVKKGIPVKIYITTTDEEHINRVSIQPFVSSSELLETGEVTVIEFTPDRAGEFKIRNIGHGFEGTIIVEE